MEIIEQNFYGTVIKGTQKQIDEMIYFMNYEKFSDPKMKKYFHIFMRPGSGLYYFPKEKYFVSSDGETNYAVAFLAQQNVYVY